MPYTFDFSADPRWRGRAIDQLAVSVDQPGSLAIDSIRVTSALPGWSFGGPAGTANWSALRNVRALTPRGAAMIVTPRAADPAIVSPAFAADTSRLSGLEIRLYATRPGTARVYLITDRRRTDATAGSMAIQVAPGWHTYTLEPDDLWVGTLLRLRVDLPGTAATRLAFIRLVDDPPADQRSITRPGQARAY